MKDSNFVVMSSWLSFDNFDVIYGQLCKQVPLPSHWFIYNDSGKEFNPGITKFPITIVKPIPNNAWYYKRLAINQSHIFKVMNKGLFKATDYFLKLDDDTIIPGDYAERLIPFMKDGSFGAISGRIESWNGKMYVPEKRASDYALGSAMFFRRELLEFWDNSYPCYPASDTLLNITSSYLGFKTMQIDSIMCKQTRLTYVNSGFNQPVSMAVKRYYLRFPWFLIFWYLGRGSKTKFFSNFKEFRGLVKNVKESERLDRPEIVRANNRRILLMILKKYRKYFWRWI